ncbi:MAG: phage minor head protein [Lachnospirales bacterium]
MNKVGVLMKIDNKTLTKYLAEVKRIEESRSKNADKKIRSLYKTLLKNLNGFIGEYYTKYADNDGILNGAILQQKAKYASFLEEVDKNIKEITPAISKTIKSTVESSYKACYDGMINGFSKSFDSFKDSFKGLSIKPEVIKAAVENPISGLTLPERLQKHRQDIIYDIKSSITNALMTGERYDTTTKKLAERLNVSYGKANRIVRTESHRVQEKGLLDGAEKIGEKVKNDGLVYAVIWRNMGDIKVRPNIRVHTSKGWKTYKSKTKANHIKMEGQVVEAGGYFDLGNGVKAKSPGESGTPENDCNCRCTLEYEMMTVEEFQERGGRWKNEKKKSRIYSEDDEIIITVNERIIKNDDKSFTSDDESGKIKTNNDIDYMSNSFRPKFGRETVNRVGSINIAVKKVDNSQFEMYTDVDNTRRNKAVRLTEKNLRKVVEQMPNGFEMPKVVVVDFDKYNINSLAIGGYMKETQTMYINSKYDTTEKIKDYINKTKGYFSNSSELAPYLHELGHKQYEDRLIEYANENSISVDKARHIVENRLMDYVSENRKIKNTFLNEYISKYAEDSYCGHIYSEIFAESLSAENSNNVIKKVLGILKLGGD